jgi:hypothetical protein
MRRGHVLYGGAAGLVFLVLLGSLGVAAQTNGRQAAATLPPEERPPGAGWLDGDPSEILLSEGLVLLLGLVAGGLLVAGLEISDSWRERRAGEVARLRRRIETALQRDRLLKDLAVTPVVHLSLWRRSATTVELRGRVPALWLRSAVLRAVEVEAAKDRAAYHIDDRLVVVPSRESEAA